MYYSSTVGTSPSDRHSVSTACVLLFTCCAVRRTAAKNSFGHCFMSLSPSRSLSVSHENRTPIQHPYCAVRACAIRDPNSQTGFSPLFIKRDPMHYTTVVNFRMRSHSLLYIYIYRVMHPRPINRSADRANRRVPD
jgi:hypothetical protein